MPNKTDKPIESHPNKTSNTPIVPKQSQSKYMSSSAIIGNDSNVQVCPDMRLTNPEDMRETKGNKDAVERLLDMNQKYLIQKVRVEDVPRPPKYSHKMPSKTGKTQYFRKFGQTNRGGSVPQKAPIEQAGSNIVLSKATITGYESIYHMDYHRKKTESLKRTAPNKYSRQQAPTFNETSYHRDYPAVAPSPTDSAKRTEVRLMGGGKLSGDTTYQHNFRLKTQGYQPAKPIIQKNNNIFMSLVTPSQKSSYNDTFKETKAGKKGKPVESCKPRQKYTPTQSRLKYKTEYAGEFIEQPIPQKRVIECLSPEELKTYVLGILHD